MNVLVTGGRLYEDEQRVYDVLDAIHAVVCIFKIIHGGAGKVYDLGPDMPSFVVGADLLAGQWARANVVAEERYDADWKKNGRGAGPIRNQKMLDEGKPAFVIAFPGGRGTADMVKRAKKAGIPVHEVKE